MNNNHKPINVSGEPIIITRNIKFLIIKIVGIDFNTSASFVIEFYDDFGLIIKNEYLTLTPEQYSLWGTSDTYIIELVCKTYGLTLL